MRRRTSLLYLCLIAVAGLCFGVDAVASPEITGGDDSITFEIGSATPVVEDLCPAVNPHEDAVRGGCEVFASSQICIRCTFAENGGKAYCDQRCQELGYYEGWCLRDGSGICDDNPWEKYCACF